MDRTAWPVALTTFLAGCASMSATGQAAVATLESTQGNATAGTVSFVQKGDKVVVTARVSGLSPGAHGFHIHEKGDCGSGDGMSVIVHKDPDDFKTQPTGNSGARVACGVIRKS